MDGNEDDFIYKSYDKNSSDPQLDFHDREANGQVIIKLLDDLDNDFKLGG